MTWYVWKSVSMDRADWWLLGAEEGSKVAGGVKVGECLLTGRDFFDGR